jgi:hypothetical protein
MARLLPKIRRFFDSGEDVRARLYELENVKDQVRRPTTFFAGSHKD